MRFTQLYGYVGVERVHPLPEGLRLAVLMEGLGSGLQVCVCVSQTEGDKSY